VTHPMSFNETEPSIAAVVGSMDAKCSRYSAEVQLQGHRVEIIQVPPPPSLVVCVIQDTPSAPSVATHLPFPALYVPLTSPLECRSQYRCSPGLPQPRLNLHL